MTDDDTTFGAPLDRVKSRAAREAATPALGALCAIFLCLTPSPDWLLAMGGAAGAALGLAALCIVQLYLHEARYQALVAPRAVRSSAIRRRRVRLSPRAVHHGITAFALVSVIILRASAATEPTPTTSTVVEIVASFSSWALGIATFFWAGAVARRRRSDMPLTSASSAAA